MAQDLTVNIKTTSDVPQAMNKAGAAVNNFDKQISGIKEAFSTSFKSIFLSFLGPMALVTAAMALIGKMIADNQKKREDANQAAIDDTNKLMSAEDKYWANKRNNEANAKKTVEEAAVQRQQVTQQFLETDPRGKAIFEKEKINFNFKHLTEMGYVSNNPEVQAQVQAMIAEERKLNPAAGMKADSKDGTFKGPEGFSNVVGVGSNPVMEAMTKQYEEQQKQTALLEQIANGHGVATPFTENPRVHGHGGQM